MISKNYIKMCSQAKQIQKAIDTLRMDGRWGIDDTLMILREILRNDS